MQEHKRLKAASTRSIKQITKTAVMCIQDIVQVFRSLKQCWNLLYQYIVSTLKPVGQQITDEKILIKMSQLSTLIRLGNFFQYNNSILTRRSCNIRISSQLHTTLSTSLVHISQESKKKIEARSSGKSLQVSNGSVSLYK